MVCRQALRLDTITGRSPLKPVGGDKTDLQGVQLKESRLTFQTDQCARACPPRPSLPLPSLPLPRHNRSEPGKSSPGQCRSQRDPAATERPKGRTPSDGDWLVQRPGRADA